MSRLEKGSILVTIALGLNTLWNDHQARKRNRDLDERDRRIRELEDRIRALDPLGQKSAPPAPTVV
jgi:hypothetical protein